MSDMSELDKKHMLCDLLGSYLGSQWKWDFESKWDIPKAANICKNWPNWKYVEELYTDSYDETKLLQRSRWPKSEFNYERYQFIKWVKCLLIGKIDFEEFTTGLYAFDCVVFYLTDLQWHQYAVRYVGKKLFPNDKELASILENHDNDKWDGYIIAAYVLKWIYDIEIIELDQKLKNMCMDEFIYDTIEDAKRKSKQVKTDLAKTSAIFHNKPINK
ncbi:hypothetical protein AVEN_167038-1 [Araneus ventricosus]|uniref:Uncharacterized protein n=1 Tax=Araneus ventricosus TaxID=182803 RepID=A0A4Y2SIY6_ARAVE|nr:hypothetical protein AVEN_167038-1 [Araneus ventricosus]